ncbi:phage tail tape measure protein [Pseudomonas koreensis]|uniref:Phage tail tape measure protein n=1 Tax=Pseudomonas koreensis TaxID=198620 RepID=A0AA94EHP5_9PSED|nr:phage tail tape measure protein [Pseudomonas koreensis]RVD74484.1 phage tail tape measure protein [Pseudomonas koreensis]
MAESKNALMYADESTSAANRNLSLVTANTNLAKDSVAGLRQTLTTASDRILLLTTAIDSLNLTLATKRDLSQSMASNITGLSEQKSSQKVAGATPPDSLKAAVAMDSAAAALSDAARISRTQGKEAAHESLIMASAPLVAAGGTTGVELVNAAALGAKAGVGLDLPNASDKKFELLKFADDAAITASAFKVPGLQAAEMMAVWRTSMKLTRDEAIDLADAAHHLGKMTGDVNAADIGSVLQQSGDAAIAAGFQPEQSAALSAALLNTGTKEGEAGAALKSISTALSKGGQVSAVEQGAWKQLGLDPKAVAAAMRDPNKDNAQGALLSVLAALNARPPEQRAVLARTLFSDGGDAAQKLSQNLSEVNEAFWQVKDKRQYATSELGEKSSVRQAALALSNTYQGQLNILNARRERLDVAKGNALDPSSDTLASAGVDKLSELTETYPKTAGVVLTVSAFLKPLFDHALDAIGSEIKDRFGKKVVDKGLSVFTGAATGTAEGAAAGTGLKILEQTSRVRAPLLESTTAAMRPLSRAMPWPVKTVAALAGLAAGVASGDETQIAKSVGAAGGGMAGALAGSAFGASLGAVGGPPGVAIGGLLGGLLGGWLGTEGGSLLGEKLGSAAPDKLEAPAQVSQALASAQVPTVPATYAPTVQVYCSDPGSAEKIGQLVDFHLRSQFSNEFTPLMGSHSLATRRDAALTDGVAT